MTALFSIKVLKETCCCIWNHVRNRILLSESFSFKAFQESYKQSRKKNENSDIKSMLLWRLQLCECSFLFLFSRKKFLWTISDNNFHWKWGLEKSRSQAHWKRKRAWIWQNNFFSIPVSSPWAAYLSQKQLYLLL